MAAEPTAVRAIPVADNELARRVLHWLGVGGIVLGGVQAVVTAAMLTAWGLPLSIGMSPGLNVLYRVSAAVGVIAPVMLFAGSFGLLREKHWARPLLTCYAFLQVCGALASEGVGLWFVFNTNPPWTAAQRAVSTFGGVESLVLHCVYPVAVILFLVRPGLMAMALPPASTFEVLPAARAAEPAPPGRP